MDFAREWTAFAGAVFALMGAALAAAAGRHAEDVLAWERQWAGATGAEPKGSEEDRRARWTGAYRWGGIVFLGAGLALIGCAAAGVRLFVPRDPVRETLPGGIFLTACGAFMAANAFMRRRGSRGPRFLLGDPLAADQKRTAGESVALWCVRALIALFILFGLRLLREARP